MLTAGRVELLLMSPQGGVSGLPDVVQVRDVLRNVSVPKELQVKTDSSEDS